MTLIAKRKNNSFVPCKPKETRSSHESWQKEVSLRGGMRPRRQTQRAILIPALLPFYSNFLAFKPSKRVYLRNIIAEQRRTASGGGQGVGRRGKKKKAEGWGAKRRRWAGNDGSEMEKVEVPTLINLRPKMVKPR